MSAKSTKRTSNVRRRFTAEFKRDAVQMLAFREPPLESCALEQRMPGWLRQAEVALEMDKFSQSEDREEVHLSDELSGA